MCACSNGTGKTCSVIGRKNFVVDKGQLCLGSVVVWWGEDQGGPGLA